MSSSPVVMWYRHDLRIADHPGLTGAARSGAPVLALYVLDDISPGPWRPGGASQWWLGRSLAALRNALQENYGVHLALVSGRAADVVPEIAARIGASSVHCSRDYEPWSIAVEKEVREKLAANGAELKRYRSRVLFEPDTIATLSGEPYRMFSPFWRVASRLEIGQPLPAPAAVPNAAEAVDIDDEVAWAEIARVPRWAESIDVAWKPGERGAHARLAEFLDRHLAGYKDGRDRPDVEATSGISPYLHFGELSPRQVWHAASARAASTQGAGASLDTFLKELGWREFSYNLLFHWPRLPDEPLRSDFDNMPWRDDEDGLRAWQQGRTGYPIVDAGMRQLWQTGWMHNRVRMITASFLVKDLLIAWQRGEAWFWDCLVDADLASNAASWQWVTGSGADPAPFFRIFNPVKQGETFDPDGVYVRRYVPELAELPSRYIHAPWLATPEVLEAAGVRLGETYPERIVDHATARARALSAFEAVKAPKPA